MSKIKGLFLLYPILLLAFMLDASTTFSSVLAQSVTRLTFYTGSDLNPAWDPRGVTIAYVRSKTTTGSVFDAYRVLSSGQGGEQALLTGLNSDFGVAVGLNWFGTTGFLGVEEAISGFEVLKFNTALAPFDRTTANGADSANELLLSINGGGGGGLFKISRDGNVALTRFSTSGSGGNITIRSGLASTLTGQVSSAFGTILLSVNSGSDGRYLNGGALSPDGSQYILPVPIGSSTTGHDLILSNTTPGAPTTNLTNNAASGVFNINPEYSPDGTKIAFARWSGVSGETYDLYYMNADGTGVTQLTNTPHFSETTPTWSPDGTSIAFTGVHQTGHESEFPALEPGETFNANIYLLNLPALNVVTPKTVLTEPPTVDVNEKNVTFTLAAFTKAQKAVVAKQARALIDADRLLDKAHVQAAKRPAVKYTFNYELVVTKNGGKKKDEIRRTSKKNAVTLKKVPVGTYSAKYRVEIIKKVGSKTSVAGRTKFSPAATFSVE